MNHKEIHIERSSVVSHLSLRLVHIVITWVMDNLGNSFVLNSFLEFLEHSVKEGFEKLLIGIFVKLNFMTTLIELYNTIYVNGVFCNIGRTEEKLLLLKETVRICLLIEDSIEKFN